MKIEEILKSTSPMDISKKIILNILYTQNVISDSFNEILKSYFEKANKKRDVQLGPEGS